MNGITSRCISFAQGNKDPLERVNYEFGLVLGVDEFVDEQCYFLEKEYQHNRALHGYGTISGLLVSAAENGEDIEIQVDTGIGIDQYGRVFVIRNKQCASLLSWLDDQGVNSGAQTIYVVARYDECETALVPIAGQPCSSSDQLTAPSRIRDSFKIELTLEAPEHPARDAVVNLAEFLSRFRVDPNAPDRSGLGAPNRLANIIGPDLITRNPANFITHIDDVVENITGNTGDTILPIQPQIVESLLNDIFVYWITEVRPTLDPDLIDPDAPETADGEPFPAEILLAQIDLTLPAEGDLELDDITIDNTTRPYLLHTQLIQELFDIPDLEDGERQKDVSEFVTLKDVPGRVRTLSLWIHIGENLALSEDNVFLNQVMENGDSKEIEINGLKEDDDRRSEMGRFYTLTTFADFEDGDFLFLRFDTNSIKVGDDQIQSLTEFIEDADFTYENYSSSQERIYKFHIVNRPDVSVEIDPELIRQMILDLMPPPQPTVPFVTITPITDEENIVRQYELWFHLDGFADNNLGRLDDLHQENLLIFSEPSDGLIAPISYGIEQLRGNVWNVFPQIDSNNPGLLRFTFSLNIPMSLIAFHPGDGGMQNFETLADYMDATGQCLEGHRVSLENFEGEWLVVYVREQGFARRLEE